MSMDMIGRTTSSAAVGLGNELAQLASVAGLAIPALGIVIVDPLMSLVDTACIGRTSTTQLAALAPNSAVFNMIFQASSLAA
jgi:Na+-driven multidrug efflux pump